VVGTERPSELFSKRLPVALCYFGCTLADFGFAYIASSKFQAETRPHRADGRSSYALASSARRLCAYCS